MDVIELIRRGYHAFGPGAPSDVLAMFDQNGREPSQWVVRDIIDSGKDYPTREVVALDLFGGIPPHYEVLSVEPEQWRVNSDRTRLVVTGHFRTRPRGTWDVFVLPFAHVWWIGGGRVEKVLSFLDGVELRRVAMAA